MDVSDAFLKLREQILSYNNPESEVERAGGLNLINTTNLSFFDAPQMSELFRLKAIFLSSLRRSSKSNQEYSHSVQICPTHSKAWVSWGGLCSQLSTITERQTEQMAAKGGSSSENSKVSSICAIIDIISHLQKKWALILLRNQRLLPRKRLHSISLRLWDATLKLSRSKQRRRPESICPSVFGF